MATSNTQRIAKNTLMLYARTLFTMFVSFYTSRVVLRALGVVDYGVYNVVGSSVAMYSMLSGSLASAISRFITFELGRGNREKLERVFSTAVTVQLMLALVVVLLAETVGLWFLTHEMDIPPERLAAAHWVYQFSVITFAIGLVSVPYNASIIAHEKMSTFAYIGIFEALSKLGVAYVISTTRADRLVIYALLLMLIAVTVRLIYGIYCKRRFEECSYRFTYDKPLLKEMASFAGWNFIGASSAVLRDQGGNIIINILGGGPAVNAARGFAVQISAAIQSFVQNFMTALNPQITKSYANGEHSYMMSLIFRGARFSYYILLLLALPVIINADYILTLWLVDVPAHTAPFVQLVLIFALSESLANPLVTAMLATGRIRNYQLVVGGIQLLNLPIAYVALRCGGAPEMVYVVAIGLSVCCEMARLLMLRGMIGLSVRSFLREVYFNVIAVTLIAAAVPAVCFTLQSGTFVDFLLNCTCCVGCTALSIFFVGCSGKERKMLIAKLTTIKNKCLKS